MKHPNLPVDHCANQSPEIVRKIFVQSIAPRLKGGSMDARSAISELEGWRKYHPEVFADWENLCWKYLQQPPEWVNWLIQGVKATSDTVTKADELVAAAKAAAAQPLARNGEIGNGRESRVGVTKATMGNTGEYFLRRIARDRPELLDDIGKNKRLKSARAAAIEAGIITPFPSLQLKEPSPTAQKLLAKKGKEWCLELLEELSSLVLDLPA
jgi:hypothetical protein